MNPEKKKKRILEKNEIQNFHTGKKIDITNKKQIIYKKKSDTKISQLDRKKPRLEDFYCQFEQNVHT